MVSIEDVNDKIDKLIEGLKSNPQLHYSFSNVSYILERLREAIVKEAI